MNNVTVFNRRQFLGFAAFVASGLACRRVAPVMHPAGPLPFSWDHVPLYAHIGKQSGDFTGSELDFLAKRFPLITLSNGQGRQQRGSTEAGIYEAARQIKSRNPRATILFYWNAFLDYPTYAAHAQVQPAWRLTGKNGQPWLKDGRVARYDLSRAEVREWWSDVVAAAMRTAPLDGIFADALPQVMIPTLGQQVGEQKAAAVREGARELLALTRQKLGPNKIIFANGMRAEAGREFLDWPLDGLLIEHFGHFASDSKESMKADIESLKLAAAKRKSAVLKGWPGFTWLDELLMARPVKELAKLASERITFPLACFLVGAQPGSRFCYTWGYREGFGTFEWYPEFDRPLGPPKGEATWDGFSATREFDHASVWVDLAAKMARIDWR